MGLVIIFALVAILGLGATLRALKDKHILAYFVCWWKYTSIWLVCNHDYR